MAQSLYLQTSLKFPIFTTLSQYIE
jgi:hypothetical protein